MHGKLRYQAYLPSLNPYMGQWAKETLTVKSEGRAQTMPQTSALAGSAAKCGGRDVEVVRDTAE